MSGRRGRGWNRGQSSYSQNADRLRNKLGSRPPGLKGKEIGFFYRDRQLNKPIEERMLTGPSVSLTNERIAKIRESLISQSFASSSSESTSFRKAFQRHREKDFQTLLKASTELPNTWEEPSETDERLYEEFINKVESEDYLKMVEFRQKLPAYRHRHEILEAIEKHQVVLIEGNTGCGKTTQVAQYILDDALTNKKGSKVRILCTQPRRIAATSIAERVASERAEKLGVSTGYQIRLEMVHPRSSGSILFCTTGVLMKFMEISPAINSYSHIIIDEIHERNVTTDVCLALIKQIVNHRKDLKVIIMSATLNAQTFSRFFNDCPMIHIEGFTFAVRELYLEDVLEETKFNGFKGPEGSYEQGNSRYKKKRENETSEFDLIVGNYAKSLKGRYSPMTIENLQNPQTEIINVDFIEHLIVHISYNKPAGAILVILPGFSVISKIFENLTKSPRFPSSKFVIYPLHSMLTGSDQRSIFIRPPEGVRKIIISTPLAETSITIDDVVYVINAGKMRKPFFDFERSAIVLEDQWITKANEKQRKGRAGRVQEGVCYHLYTRSRSDSLEPFEEPEILRIRLEEVLLTIKVLCIKDIRAFMSTMIDVPEPKVIDNSIELLLRLGALTDSEELTPLGLHLARLAIAPRIGKMLLLSSILSCFDPIASIASGLSFKTPFYSVMGKEDLCNSAKQNFSNDSDQLAVWHAMDKWSGQRSNQRSFCYQNFLSHTTLLMLEKMKSQFGESLYKSKFLLSSRCDHEENNKHSDNVNVLRAVICGGLYPNIAFRFVKIGKNRRCEYIKTVDNKRANLLPSSVNGDRSSSHEQGFMVYHERQKFTNSLFLTETTANVSPYAILIFGDRIKTFTLDNYQYISVGDIAKFRCKQDTAQLIIELRDGFNLLLEKKIVEPSPIVWDSDDGKLLKAILDLISVGSNTFEDYDQDDDNDETAGDDD